MMNDEHDVKTINLTMRLNRRWERENEVCTIKLLIIIIAASIKHNIHASWIWMWDYYKDYYEK
jgi:hypothetical protein